MADNTYWFRHDVDAVSDRLMQRLIRKYGMEGVGIYWSIVEVLYKENGILNLDDIEDLAFSFHVEHDLVRDIVCESDLFIIEGNEFYSERILKELAVKKEISDKAKQSIEARWNTHKKTNKTKKEATKRDSNYDRNTTVLPTNYEGNTNTIQNSTIQNNTEEEYNITPLDSKESIPPTGEKPTPKRKQFIKPTLDQVKEYCKERNNSVDPEKFIDFYDSKGWMVGKNKMVDWKGSVRTWEKGDNAQGRASPSGFKKVGKEDYPLDMSGYETI